MSTFRKRTRFSGRIAELNSMDSAFRDVSGGRQRCILLAAEAGGGKSRLVEEFTNRLSGRALILKGGCIEQQESALPYAPATGLLHELARLRGLSLIKSLVGCEGARELAWLLPELGELSERFDAGIARSRLFETLRKLFEELAQEMPLVVVIEDIHWADQGTFDLLRFLTRRLMDIRLMLIVTYRAEEASRNALRTTIGDISLCEGSEVLQLRRLTYAEIAVQLEGLLGRPPKPAVINSVYARGCGIPLFTEALIDASGSLRANVTGSLNDYLLRAVREVPPSTGGLLKVMALGGPQLTHSLLRSVTNKPDLDLVELLRPAISAG